MLSALVNAFRIPDLRKKIFFTLFIIILYRIGCFIPVPGIPFHALADSFNSSTSGSMTLLNLFAGGALSYYSVFCLGIMPYITASIIMQLMQGVIPTVANWAKQGELGRKKITNVTRWLTLAISLLNAFGYLLLFKSEAYGISFNTEGIPGQWLTDVVDVATMVIGAALIMWMGELITQRGVGNGMSLIIFANIISGFPQAILSSLEMDENGVAITIMIIVVVLLLIPLIVIIERGQRRIPVNYSKRVQGRRVMGGTSTYIPLKVNSAGVIPIIFASALIYFPAQLSAIFSDVEWMRVFADAVSTGWLNWILTFFLIIFFTYFYGSMVFNPEQTADQLRQNGGFIPGVRPGSATVLYIKNVLRRITLPGSVYLALIAVVPTILFYFTGNTLISAFGGTSILILVGVGLDTMTKVESQLKMHNYEGFFK
ncbi:MAG: preprotein translocase subunit SecY [Coriobacteriales bacterium]